MAKTSGQVRTQRLLNAHGKPCPYCLSTMDRGNVKRQPTVDHIRARSRIIRSPGEDSNKRKGRTIIACSECNWMKGALTLEEFILDLIERNKKLLNDVDTNVGRMKNIRYLLDIGLDRSEHG